ncbi:RNA-directed DNA polymerase, eukaryota [Tanacetum coccineum]
MENANPPPTNNHPVLSVALRARAVQELHVISAFVDSRLESIEQFLHKFANQPNEANMNNLESDDESMIHPLMPRTIPRLRNFKWSKIPPLLELSQRDLMNGLRHPYEKSKLMYKNCLNLGPEYQVDKSMKEWLIHRHVSIHETTLYFMRRSLEVLRKFHWTILGGRSNQLSHVSSSLLRKPWEYYAELIGDRTIYTNRKGALGAALRATMLKLSFPRLFALEVNKDCSVADKLNAPFTASFRRQTRGGPEAQQLEQLTNLLDSVSLSNMEDRCFWDLNGEGFFQVKDVRSVLDETFLPNENIPTRRVKSILIKVNIFVWKLVQDRIPTRLNLMSRIILVPSAECPVCNNDSESSSHLFFGCQVAKEVLKLICRWWDLVLYDFDNYDGWLLWFKSIRLGSKLKGVLEGVFYVYWWSIWSYRNQLLFASFKPRKSFIFDDIVFRSFNWYVARGKKTLSWVSWIQHPHLISL